ncbi:urea ABC transporter permease subunit UrtC [Synechococcus sp. Tobar12-5m-g]|uniref:urea ABC transporter permease subunit UrtC n=1 Tax=unclassified Synechococcus TaxID=2626047 RepID=UPI0020CCC0BC|nr:MULTISPECIES: urea ABC transporter permease subunit UrtC [unclassified Synechococcus]MCP9771973.1 urea ABC transporter permease subunit UrtC [Synechococcus sp. Tobar12-5m-g]MCP9872915.1 urea ABC transporter permease subunit UrtC [Synechococcus sp. Cruz CV-v-12]
MTASSPSPLRRWLPWVLIVAAGLILPIVLPPFRLNLLGRFLSLGIVALGIDLIWGFTGMLSLGQGIFFALGGYAIGMFLSLDNLEPGKLPEFFDLYGVKELPGFWQPFASPLFTFFAIWVIPAVVAGLLGFLVFRNRIKGVYFSILTQAALLVFFNFFNGQQKLINGTNGLKTDTARIFGELVGSDLMQRYLFVITVVLTVGAWLLCRWLTTGRFGDALIAIRDDEPRMRFTGYNPTTYKTLVFAVAGGLAGVSGALYTVQSGIISPQFMAVPFSIEMVIWVAVGGRGTLIGAVLGAVVINYAKSLVSEQLPETWLFIQGGLFLLVVTALPDGLVGWWRLGGPAKLQAMVGWPPRTATYPSLDLDPALRSEQGEGKP